MSHNNTDRDSDGDWSPVNDTDSDGDWSPVQHNRMHDHNVHKPLSVTDRSVHEKLPLSVAVPGPKDCPTKHTAGEPSDLLPFPVECPSQWNALPSGTPFPVECPSQWNALPSGTPFPVERPSQWNALPSGTPCPGASQRQTIVICSVLLSRHISFVVACNSASHLSAMCFCVCVCVCA